MADAATNAATQVTEEERFLFDLQGFLILRGAIEPDLVDRLLAAVEENEAKDHDESWADTFTTDGNKPMHLIKDVGTPNQIRLNGLLRMDPAFAELIGHHSYRKYLDAFMQEPQLVNTWSITQWQGCEPGGWHHGLPIEDYGVRQGQVYSPMINVITMLTPNTPGDGCLAVVPASHKMNIELPYEKFGRCGIDHPGAIEVTGEPGDVLVFSEAVSHTGTAKTTTGKRTNLQYNHVHKHRACPMWFTDLARHFWMPPEVRESWTPEQRALTHWMSYTIPDRDVPGALEAAYDKTT